MAAAPNPTIATARATWRRPWQAWTLATVEIFIAIQGVIGGVGLISDTWAMPRDWLTRTPFDTWAGPGWMLIALIAIPHLAAAIGVFVSTRLGILGGVLAGLSLLIWIAAQIALLQVFFVLQPVIAVVGFVEIGLALWWRHRLFAESRREP